MKQKTFSLVGSGKSEASVAQNIGAITFIVSAIAGVIIGLDISTNIGYTPLSFSPILGLGSLIICIRLFIKAFELESGEIFLYAAGFTVCLFIYVTQSL
ncbi:MAG: hypothetical protein NUV82_02100 [Candidatus Komeilibacteria bacterium]|nr:hypothetical protein [Candidatus Komeilibacteria bacterium]